MDPSGQFYFILNETGERFKIITQKMFIFSGDYFAPKLLTEMFVMIHQ